MLDAGPVFNTTVHDAPLFTDLTIPAFENRVAPSTMDDDDDPAVAGSTIKLKKAPDAPLVERNPVAPVDHVFPASPERRTPHPTNPPLPSPVAAYTTVGSTGSKAMAPVVSMHS
jgi:hypothetical protein